MAKNQKPNVTMRVRIGDSEVEVTGPSDFVEQKIEQFLQTKSKLTSGPVSQPVPSGQKHAAQPPTTKKRMAVAQFFKKAGPKTDVARALTAGYYLEKFENAESFTSTEIAQTIRNAKISPPSNPSDAVNKNIRKGLIMTAGDKDGKMAFVLTSDGEDAIDEMLAT